MSPADSHTDIQGLLGAYALDAVDTDERDAVEAHLAECPRCRAEVADYHEVAALMGGAGGDAPPGVWDRIASSLEEPPPPLRLTSFRPPRRQRRPWSQAAAALVAAAAVLIAVVGLGRISSDRPGREQQLARAAASALGDPHGRRVRLASTDGRLNAEGVVLPDGRGYLVRNNLPALPPGRVYQLWAIAGGQKISAGVLGGAVKLVAFQMAASDVAALAITDEAGTTGVVASTRSPVVVGEVPKTV